MAKSPNPIPESTQWALLAYKTSRDIAKAVSETAKDIPEILAVGWTPQRIRVLGARKDNSYGLEDIKYVQSNNVHNGALIDRDKFKYAFSWFSREDSPLEIAVKSAVGMFTLGIWPATHLLPSVRKRVRKTKEFYEEIENILKANTTELEKFAEHVSVYQTSMREVMEELGRPLERVETGNQVSCLRGINTAYGKEDNSTLWLRAEAGMLGADAVVHYAPGSAIGTPVRFADK